jgi:hypothetical protein
LHDQEIWVIDVELDTLEDSLDDILLGFVTVQKVFGDIGESNLTVITTVQGVERAWHKTERTCLITVI